MTNREHIIKALEEAIPFVENRGYGGVAETMHDALYLLKREPKQVIGIHDDIIEGMEVGNCPSCNRLVVNLKIDEQTKFCKFCGQAVKWNDN